MAVPSLEDRVTERGIEPAEVDHKSETAPQDTRPWWERIRGTFKDDPAYEEAMRLGREYRESLRPREDEGD